ncbi:WYL domain-containing protein [Paenibacillus thalictri]|uniref:WYL domain-containing protein n=1 Tax=Paenibacillus thalictri TaxID=2527873 RepID=A0A4Q9DWN2_9BACL|nr:WYL domain-containing protein [Paenibacillus thalictri]TBL80816.1 WYL domain-containing protein [Paenibacillus thalictri]
MNLFEKIFNYQIISRLEDSGTFMATSHERAWLKTMLEHPAASEAFTAETLKKLRAILSGDQTMDTANHFIEKARSMERQVYHPLLRGLRRYIMQKSAVRMTYEIRSGQINYDHSGLPYKLEYSMVKREWYLLWYHLRHHALMTTRLSKIISIAPEPISPAGADRILRHFAETLESRKIETVIQVVQGYNKELSRILYAFSCFEKDVEYDEASDCYHVKVRLLGDEAEYLLSKIRFLGKRVRVIEGDYLKKRMLEASTKALERYQAMEDSEELTS